MRIAFITETWLPSVNGVTTRLAATFAELRRRRHELMLISPAGRDAKPPGVALFGAPSASVPFLYGGEPWGLPLPRVARWLDAFAPHVVHAVNPLLLGWAGIACARRRGIPLVCSYHTHVADYAQYYHLGFARLPTWALVTAAHQRAHVNLAASAAARTELEAHGIRGVRVWPGAVDLNLFHPGRASWETRRRLSGGHPERQLVIYVGRLASEKSVERLLPLAAPESPRHLALIGDGPARAYLQSLFAGCQVTFAGILKGPELAAAYASADAFAFPSTTDTLGMVMLEALASGLPVIAARSRASEEVLTGSAGGCLFQAEDPAAAVKAAELVRRNPVDRMEVSRQAHLRTRTWAQATDGLLDAYHAAASRKLGRAA